MVITMAKPENIAPQQIRREKAKELGITPTAARYTRVYWKQPALQQYLRIKLRDLEAYPLWLPPVHRIPKSHKPPF
ncbi:MAG: hypothetical protein H6540_06420 [Bacteroidales bacterium]|nr:hypothetical protein [Bacteroidales bacterium]